MSARSPQLCHLPAAAMEPSKNTVTMQNDCMYGQGGKGKASFYNYVTRSLVSLSKSTARGVTKTLCAKEMKRMNICTISVVLVFSR